MAKVSFTFVGAGFYYINLDGVKVGEITSGPERYVRLKDENGDAREKLHGVPVARFKHGKNKLKDAKTFCEVVLAKYSVQATIDMLYRKHEIAPLTLQQEIQDGRR